MQNWPLLITSTIKNNATVLGGELIHRVYFFLFFNFSSFSKYFIFFYFPNEHVLHFEPEKKKKE